MENRESIIVEVTSIRDKDPFTSKASEELRHIYKSLEKYGIKPKCENRLISPEDIPCTWKNIKSNTSY